MRLGNTQVIGEITTTTTITTTTEIDFVIEAIGPLNIATQAAALDAEEEINLQLQRVNIGAIIGAVHSRYDVAARHLAEQALNLEEATGRIMDADIAEEAANLVRYRILLRGRVAVLTQANQLPALCARAAPDRDTQGR